jgi:hypothetical protein
MANVAPQARQPLSADALFRVVHPGFDHIPDDRPADVDMTLSDVLMSAFALFARKAPSLLAFDKERAEGHWHPIYGLQRVPCDTDRRERLALVSPKWLRPVCTSVWRHLQRGKALEALPFLDGHSLLALDGTESVSSKTMHCASCFHRVPRNGSITYTPQLWGAAIIHPDQRAVMPRMPEPLVNRDGTSKHAGARQAAKRFVAKLRQDHPPLKCLGTDESRRAHAPPMATLQEDARHSILGGKEGDHTSLFQQVQAAEHAGRVTLYERHDRAAGLGHRFRLLHNVPLHASNGEVRGNCIEYWEMGQGKLQHFRWLTDLRVTTRHVLHLMRAGRARWKLANETFNTLPNQG